jgi:hypothetical protein
MKPVSVRSWRRTGRYVGWALLILAVLLLVAWSVFYEFFFRPAIFRAMLEAITDVRLQGVSLEEARRRAPFPICLPEWLPEGLEGPEIAFHAEWGAPWVADVTLVYRRHGESILRISQAYREAPDQDLRVIPHKGQLEQDARNVAYALLEWQVGSAEARKLMSQAKIYFQEIDRNEHRFEVYELLEPQEYRSVWVDWGGDQLFPHPYPYEGAPPYAVFYEVYSRLSLSETFRVVENLTNCLAPLPTPPSTFHP